MSRGLFFLLKELSDYDYFCSRLCLFKLSVSESDALGLFLLSIYLDLFFFSSQIATGQRNVCYLYLLKFDEPKFMFWGCFLGFFLLSIYLALFFFSKCRRKATCLLCLSTQIQITSKNILGLFPRSKYLAFFLSFKTELSKDMSGFVLCASSKFTKKTTNVLCARLQSKIPDCLFMF